MNPHSFKNVIARILSVLLTASFVSGCNLVSVQGQNTSETPETVALNKQNRQAVETPETVALNKQNRRTVSEKRNSLAKFYHQGRSRSYYLYTPSSYRPKRSMPLILAFHGGGGQGEGLAKTTELNNLAEQQGFIVVYPNAIGGHWNDGRGAVSKDVNDISFVTTLIDKVTKLRNINSRRIYAMGMSNGGIFTQRLACELPNKIAAFASVAGSLAAPIKSNCRPSSNVSILMINGKDDQAVPWEGGKVARGRRGEVVSVPETVNFWRQQNRCSTSPVVSPLPDTDPEDGTRVKISRYSGCRGNAEVVLVEVDGGGHSWPGGVYENKRRRSGSRGNVSQDINASQLIWKFFQSHSLS